MKYTYLWVSKILTLEPLSCSNQFDLLCEFTLSNRFPSFNSRNVYTFLYYISCIYIVTCILYITHKWRYSHKTSPQNHIRILSQ